MTNQNTTPWTTDRLTQLRDLVALGYSAEQISRRLDISRNAVCGAIHRHGIRGGRQKRIPTHKNAVKRIATKFVIPPPLVLPCGCTIVIPPPLVLPCGCTTKGYTCEKHSNSLTVAPLTSPVSFADLAPGECRFPLWPNGESGTRGSPACGCLALEGKPYCAEHWRVTHTNQR